MSKPRIIERKKAAAITAKIVEFLERHIGQGTIFQKCYQQDFLRLFEEAFLGRFCERGYRYDKLTGKYILCKTQRPLITGDTIRSIGKKYGWISDEGVEKSEEAEILKALALWDAWILAYQWNRPKRRYTRRR